MSVSRENAKIMILKAMNESIKCYVILFQCLTKILGTFIFNSICNKLQIGQCLKGMGNNNKYSNSTVNVTVLCFSASLKYRAPSYPI